MKLPTITLEVALEILRILGSDEDTVRVKCGNHCKRWIEKEAKCLLGEQDNPNEKANRIYISYFNEKSNIWVYGTLAGMVMERMGCR
ncbi:hypothetical protein LCGC14_0775570 [marine sediment metagenome]|uniref:Uncharacterized protein n=1 Tax=marine sediment metagenome TaxID=412755 RepID=A0A0F9QH26_9ZZZZ